MSIRPSIVVTVYVVCMHKWLDSGPMIMESELLIPVTERKHLERPVATRPLRQKHKILWHVFIHQTFHGAL